MKKLGRILSLAGMVFLTAAFSLSAQTKITGYLLGAAPNGMPAVMKELNDKLQKDLNASVTINYIGWSDLNSKYPLVLAAGEGIDWIYTADWCQYTPQAVRGAFKELTPELLQKYMPRHWAATPKEAWEQVKVNGKIFMIPGSTPDRKVPVFIIRGDLRKKYGLPPLKSFADIEPYLAAIKKNEPGMIPINLDNSYDLGQPYGAVLNQYAPPNWPIFSPFYGNFEDPTKTPYNIVTDEPWLSAFKKTANVMRNWYDKGYFNKNPFANTVMSRDSFVQGKSAVAFGNSQNVQDTLTKAKQAGFEPEILTILSSTGHYPADPFTNNAVAIAANSKNVEKTLQFLDLIMEEPSYEYLVYFGVKGKNYVETADGKIGLPAGLAPDKNDYPPDAAGFWFTNKDLHKPLAIWDSQYIALRSQLKSVLYNSYFTGFSFVPDKVKTEVANMSNVWTQYGNPLMVGLVPNVDKAIENLAQKLKAAGIDKVKKELQAQTAAYRH